MFGNDNAETNGESTFFNDIKKHINVIFDVGCRSNSLFSNFEGEVHYFDPVTRYITDLKSQPNINSKSYFNNFGLGNEEKQLYYYPKYESFYNRIESCRISDESNKILLQIKKAKDYMIENNVKDIDFLKIDTEGYELQVLQGFEELLANVKLIQFEYGGTNIDNKIKLRDITDYLTEKGFCNFSYLVNKGHVPITDFNDHFQYCNIICLNKNSKFASTPS
jgi:FkbM family methyltransferase